MNGLLEEGERGRAQGTVSDYGKGREEGREGGGWKERGENKREAAILI